MKLTRNVKRNLRAESLESRQLLHGGAMTAGGEAITSEERATEVVARFDANEDMELSADEVSERLWNRLSQADGDESATVSVEELTVHLDQVAAERAENDSAEDGDEDGRTRNRNRSGGDRTGRGGERVSVEDRIDSFFAENDTDMDGVITAADDVSEELLERLADADIDGDGISADDLLARHEARQQARFDARFDALDENGDGGITADEVSERRWESISAADGEDGDGIVTADELQTYLDLQRAEREAEREAEDEVEDGEETVGEVAAEEVAATQTQAQRQGPSQAIRAARRR